MSPPPLFSFPPLVISLSASRIFPTLSVSLVASRGVDAGRVWSCSADQAGLAGRGIIDPGAGGPASCAPAYRAPALAAALPPPRKAYPPRPRRRSAGMRPSSTGGCWRTGTCPAAAAHRSPHLAAAGRRTRRLGGGDSVAVCRPPPRRAGPGAGAGHGAAGAAPGAEAEVDFGEFHAVVAGVLLKLWMFVLRLSCSGRAFHVAFATQAQEAFLEGHVLAFEYFGAVPGRVRYDTSGPPWSGCCAAGTAPSPSDSSRCARTTGSTRSSASRAGRRAREGRGGRRDRPVPPPPPVPVPAVASLAALNQLMPRPAGR